MSDGLWETLVVMLFIVLSLPVLYVAFRMASAGWHRSKIEIERRYKQGDNDGAG